MKVGLCSLVMLLCLHAYIPISSAKVQGSLTAAEQLHQQACSVSPYVSDAPWHIANLYNCLTRELFIPYQLWKWC